MHRTACGGLLVLLSLAACTHVRPTPPRSAGAAAGAAPTAVPAAAPAAAGTAKTSVPPAVSAGQVASTAPERPAGPAAQVNGMEAAPAKDAAAKATARSTAAPAPAKAPVGDAAKIASSHVGAAATTPAKDEHAAPAAKESSVAATSQKPSAALALDLAALEQRLRDTHAIGVFTKLSLKNQVDDLLNAFRAFHSGRPKASLADLHQRYDLLLIKVLSLLQDGDPPLAAAISASRDTIWGILVDPEKFQKV